MSKAVRINLATGFYVTDIPFYEGEQTEEIILVLPPEKLHRPKWDGQQWIEGMSPAEIEAKKPLPAPDYPKAIALIANPSSPYHFLKKKVWDALTARPQLNMAYTDVVACYESGSPRLGYSLQFLVANMPLGYRYTSEEITLLNQLHKECNIPVNLIVDQQQSGQILSVKLNA